MAEERQQNDDRNWYAQQPEKYSTAHDDILRWTVFTKRFVAHHRATAFPAPQCRSSRLVPLWFHQTRSGKLQAQFRPIGLDVTGNRRSDGDWGKMARLSPIPGRHSTQRAYGRSRQRCGTISREPKASSRLSSLGQPRTTRFAASPLWVLGLVAPRGRIPISISFSSSSIRKHFVPTTSWLDAIDWKSTGVGPTTRRDALYGALWSRHVRVDDGLEVEFGFAPLSWATRDPPDPGTARVISGGCRVLYDPDAMLAAAGG